MTRVFAVLCMVLLFLVAAILWWAQTGSGQYAGVLVIKQLTIASLFILVLVFVLWLMKTLLDAASLQNESESITMRIRDNNNEEGLRAPLIDSAPVMPSEQVEAEIDTQAELDRIRVMIARDPEKVAQVVNRWIDAHE